MIETLHQKDGISLSSCHLDISCGGIICDVLKNHGDRSLSQHMLPFFGKEQRKKSRIERFAPDLFVDELYAESGDSSAPF